MMTEIVDRLRCLIAEFCGITLSDICSDSQLLYDLRIDGDDADDLFLKIEEHFGVDLSDIDLSEYFRSESFLARGDKKKLSIADVARMIENRL